MSEFSNYIFDSIFEWLSKYPEVYLLYDGKKWMIDEYVSGDNRVSERQVNDLLPIRNFKLSNKFYKFKDVYFIAESDSIKTIVLYDKQKPTYYHNFMAKTMFEYIAVEDR